MKEIKEKLIKYFDNAFATLEENKAFELHKELLILKEDMFSVLDVYNDETKQNWQDLEERFVDFAKEFEKISSNKDLKIIASCFKILKSNREFEKNLLRTLGKKENDTWSSEDIKPAIFTILKEYRKEIKAKNDAELLRKYDNLKFDIKEVISGEFTDSKHRKYNKVKEEMRSDLWNNDPNIKFLSTALYLYAKFCINERIMSILGKYNPSLVESSESV